MSSSPLEASLYKQGEWNESTHATYKIIHATTFGALNISLSALESPRVPKPEETAPAANDIISIGGVDYDRYPLTPGLNDAPARMSPVVVAQFISDTNLATKTKAANLALERTAMATVLITVSPTMRQNLDNIPGSASAMASHDPYAVWPFLIRAVTTPGARRAMKVFQDLCELTMNDELRDHAAYAAHLRGVLQEFTQLFADHRQNALPNTVSIDVLGSVVYLNGILTSRSRAQFQFIVDKTLAAVAQMSDLPPPGDLIAIFHSFALNLRNDAPIAEPVMGYVAPAVKTSAPLAVKKCVTCKASFVPMLEHHTFCTSCSRAGITAQRATRAAAETKALVSPAAPPTPVAVVETYSREQWEACLSPQMQQLMAF